MQLSGRVAFITGAGSGIGKASAILMAQEGAKVALLGRTERKLLDVVNVIQHNGGEALPLVADVSKPDQMQRAVQKIIDTWGRLDIVFANAGINGIRAPIEEIEPEEWDEVMEINLKGTFLTVKYTVPYLRKQGGGSIIVDSSINGTRIFSNTAGAAYGASKGGQVAFAKMIALQLARDKIRVNVICPGAIVTEIEKSTYFRNAEKVERPVIYPEGSIPLTGGYAGKPEQVAQLVLFLASDASDLITGTEVWIDGGQSLIEG